MLGLKTCITMPFVLRQDSTIAVAAFARTSSIYHHAGDNSVKNLFYSAESKELSQDTKTIKVNLCLE